MTGEVTAKIALGTALALVLIVPACASSKPKSHTFIQAGGLTVYSTDNDQKMLYMKRVSKNEQHRFCLTPPHDSVVGNSDATAITSKVAGVEGGYSEARTKSDLSLGGRSPSVLISRELMYRACELSANVNADLETTLKIYERFLQSVDVIAKTQTGAGTPGLSLLEHAPAITGSTSSAASSGDDSGDDDGDDDGDDVDLDDGSSPSSKGGTIDTDGLD